MRKALCTLVLSLALALCLPFAAFADYSEGYLYYTVADESITITGSFGKPEEITVPAMIANIPVNTIASGAFVDKPNLKKVNLPDTVQSVQEGAIGPGITVVFNYNTDQPQEYTPTSSGKTTLPDGTVVESEGVTVETIDVVEADGSTGASGSAGGSSSSSGALGLDKLAAAVNGNIATTGIVVAIVVVIAAGVVIAVVVSRKRKAQVQAQEQAQAAASSTVVSGVGAGDDEGSQGKRVL